MALGKQLFVLFLFAACLATCSAYTRMGRMMPRARVLLANYTCGSEGFFCGDCGNVVYCEPNPSGGFDPVISENCKDMGMYCNEQTVSCTLEFTERCNPTVGTYVFGCQQVGLFPNPFNCKQYYFCATVSTSTSTAVTPTDCPGGYGFDPRTSACTIKFSNGTTCTNPVKPCTGAGSFPITRNPRLYYNCVKENANSTVFYPRLYYCTRNYRYIGGRCVDPTTYYDGLLNGKCKEKGNFYVPSCKQYNECSGVNATAYLRTCYQGQYFDINKSACVYPDCDMF